MTSRSGEREEEKALDFRDFGLKGKTAFVCGSSAGLGRACAGALAAHGASVWINGRSEERLRRAAGELSRAHGVEVLSLAADVTTAEGRQAMLAACPSPDILVNNSDGPPPGDFRDFGEGEWHRALTANMVSPILLIRQYLDGMVARGWGRIINITSTSVKAPLPLLGLSNGARSGLTGFVSGLAREVGATGVTINNILPGRMETDRLRRYVDAVAARDGVPAEQSADLMKRSNPMKRFGQPEELGALCAFVASTQAGFITGQNFIVDGGEYMG